ncbi:MAG TPA: ketoacyl-ACP synthase III family protein [Mycobacteriales bacterium]|nr:ketoacyl-ACP synthase III family protein [Mycobacteriales bacterium]
MKFEDLFIAGHGVWLPRAIPVTDALAAGLCTPVEARRTQILSVSTASPGEEESPPRMAARAATEALERSGHSSLDVDLILHATVYYQGHDLWGAASYVQRVVVGNRCPAIEVRQMSNGGMAALELAAGYLMGGRDRFAALLTAADRFGPPGFDRWHSDLGTVYADGGAALVLSRRGGYARLLSLVSYADAELEGMHRGNDPFGLHPFSVRPTVDLETCKKDFLRDYGLSASIARVNAGQGTAIKEALADADVELGDIDWFVLPHLGRRRLEVGYLRPLGITADRTTWDWGRTIGHLGAGDQFAGLGHLVDSGRATPGDRLLVIGAGAGFTWSAAVVQIERQPTWAGAAAVQRGAA